MKYLIIGSVVFIGWSALSTSLYVCQIKGLCKERETVLINTVGVKDIYSADILPNTLAGKPESIPGNLKIYFEFDKAELPADAETARSFDKSIQYLYQNLKASITITGYTDAVGSDEYNLALGESRAFSVQRYLKSKGITAEKITTGSRGEKDPEGDNNTADGRANNRRTLISVKN